MPSESWIESLSSSTTQYASLANALASLEPHKTCATILLFSCTLTHGISIGKEVEVVPYDAGETTPSERREFMPRAISLFLQREQ